MTFAEQRAALATQLGQLEEVLRQAQGISRGLEERAEAAASETESFADDTVVAQISSTAKRARQDLGALLRAVGAVRGNLGN